MKDDYELFIDDYKPTKDELIKIFNEHIRANAQAANTVKGIEIHVLPEWETTLNDDGSIIRAYEKRGWKVMWYKVHSEGPARGKLVRSWLSFRNPTYIKRSNK